jgi:RNA polymerase sigma-70 factor (ECF subfamily)
MTADNDMLTDAQLWELASKGDIGAFERLYKRYWAVLLDDAYRRLRVREEAEEVVQEVFIDLYTRREQIAITRNIVGYLHKAVQFRVYNKIRSYIVQRSYRQLAALRLEDQTNCVHADTEFRELNTAIQKAILRLPEKCREVFILSREDGLGHKQIAQQLHISQNTVERHINKALKYLREEFGTVEAEPLLLLIIAGTTAFLRK